MSDLKSFNLGFLDGYRGNKRKTNQGGVYLRAFKKGAEAKLREVMGGDELGSVSPRKRKVALA